MNRLEEIYELTRELAALIENPVQSKDRPDIISRMTEMLDKREVYLQGIKPPYTEDENETGREIVRINSFIERNMQQIFIELKHEMQQVKQQKKSNRTYTNPYENVAAMDGMFLDHKK